MRGYVVVHRGSRVSCWTLATFVPRDFRDSWSLWTGQSDRNLGTRPVPETAHSGVTKAPDFNRHEIKWNSVIRDEACFPLPCSGFNYASFHHPSFCHLSVEQKEVHVCRTLKIKEKENEIEPSWIEKTLTFQWISSLRKIILESWSLKYKSTELVSFQRDLWKTSLRSAHWS